MIRLACLLALMPGLAWAELQMTSLRYACARGVEVAAVYVTQADSAVAVIVVEGRQISLYGEAAASGARYGWPSGGSNYVWLTKDKSATLLWKDGASGTETVLLAECATE